MGRKLSQYKVTEEGRDKGKVFLLTEMSAAQAEAWAMRVLLALSASNVELPPDWEELGMGGLAELGIRALGGLKWETAEPLLAEMFECIQAIPDPSKMQMVRQLVDSDIEEVKTRLNLRAEVWKLHMDFLGAVVPSISPTKRATASGGHVTKTSAK